MNKEFDFDDIGKKTPYRTPDNFFEDMQQKVMERTWRRATPETSFTDNVLYCHSGSCNTGRGIVWFRLISGRKIHLQELRICWL